MILGIKNLGQIFYLKITGRIATLLDAIKIEQHDTQNHDPDRAEFALYFQESFGSPSA